MRIIGIDPGLSGGICLYNSGKREISSLFEMPVEKLGVSKERLWVDGYRLYCQLQDFYADLAIVESVNAMPGQGVTSMFRFGHCLGVVDGVLGALNLPVVRVPPGTWKLAMRVTRDKQTSITMFHELFPVHKDVTHDGMAEAALIAVWGSLYAT